FRWHKEVEFESKITYTKHRVAEAYLWALGTYIEPEYSQARVTLASVVILLTALDDMWLPEAPTGIHSMKHLYRVTIDFYDKLEEELEMQGKSGCGSHLKKSLKSTANGYMQEAKWLRKDYTAKFDEYKENAILSSAYYTMMAMTFAGMGDFAKLDAFEWLSSQPKIRIASEIICQFTNDITSYEYSHTGISHKQINNNTIKVILNRTWRGSYLVDCYMKQFCVSKEQAVQVIANIVSTAWKDLNRELMRPHSFCFPFLIRILNLSRVIDVFYRYTDAYTNPKFLKEHIVSLIIENIPN
ncbi:unnamed protein product, partial [Brassica napus]